MADLINVDKVSHPFGAYSWSAQRDLFQAGKLGLLDRRVHVLQHPAGC